MGEFFPHAGHGEPEVRRGLAAQCRASEFQEAEGYKYTIRLKANKVLVESVAHLLTRRACRPVVPRGRCDPARRVLSVPEMKSGRYSLGPGSASESVIRLRAKSPTIGNVGSGDRGKVG